VVLPPSSAWRPARSGPAASFTGSEAASSPTDGIARVEGNYPSKGGRGELAAWFRDLDDNMFGIAQPL
jgi:hypothetical protein